METQPAFQQFFQFFGPYLWPLLILAAMVLYLVVLQTYRVFYKRMPEQRGLNAILFWGCIAGLTGLIGQMGGAWMMLRTFLEAPDVSPQILITGFLSTYAPALFGLTLALFSALAWWALRARLAELRQKAEQ